MYHPFPYSQFIDYVILYERYISIIYLLFPHLSAITDKYRQASIMYPRLGGYTDWKQVSWFNVQCKGKDAYGA